MKHYFTVYSLLFYAYWEHSLKKKEKYFEGFRLEERWFFQYYPKQMQNIELSWIEIILIYWFFRKQRWMLEKIKTENWNFDFSMKIFFSILMDFQLELSYLDIKTAFDRKLIKKMSYGSRQKGTKRAIEYRGGVTVGGKVSIRWRVLFPSGDFFRTFSL